MSAPRPRFWLVTLSVTAHAAMFAAVFLSGVWRLDRLDADPSRLDIAVMVPPPAEASGSPAALPAPKFTHKPPTVVDHPVQPVPKPVPTPPDVATPDTTPGNGEGSGSGSGKNPDGPPDGPGTCATPPCGPDTGEPVPSPKPEPVHVDPVPAIVGSAVMGGLRYSGDPNIRPPEVVRARMLRDDHPRSIGTFKICLSDTGLISSIAMVRSTGYDQYDKALADGIRTWLYRPYMVGGRGVPACSMVTFVYTIK